MVLCLHGRGTFWMTLASTPSSSKPRHPAVVAVVEAEAEAENAAEAGAWMAWRAGAEAALGGAGRGEGAEVVPTWLHCWGVPGWRVCWRRLRAGAAGVAQCSRQRVGAVSPHWGDWGEAQSGEEAGPRATQCPPMRSR